MTGPAQHNIASNCRTGDRISPRVCMFSPPLSYLHRYDGYKRSEESSQYIFSARMGSSPPREPASVLKCGAQSHSLAVLRKIFIHQIPWRLAVGVVEDR